MDNLPKTVDNEAFPVDNESKSSGKVWKNLRITGLSQRIKGAEAAQKGEKLWIILYMTGAMLWIKGASLGIKGQIFVDNQEKVVDNCLVEGALFC